MPEDTHVIDSPDRSRYELIVDGQVAGFVRYRVEGDHIVLVHTEVDEAFAGQGFASRLLRGTLDLIRDTSRPTINDCPFITRWVRRNPQYAGIAVEATPPLPGSASAAT